MFTAVVFCASVTATEEDRETTPLLVSTLMSVPGIPFSVTKSAFTLVVIQVSAVASLDLSTLSAFTAPPASRPFGSDPSVRRGFLGFIHVVRFYRSASEQAVSGHRGDTLYTFCDVCSGG